MEHVRTRPGMYIESLATVHSEDGIMSFEVLNNKYRRVQMQAGKKIEIIVEEICISVYEITDGEASHRKLVEAVSVLNTGGKYDSKHLKRSVMAWMV